MLGLALVLGNLTASAIPDAPNWQAHFRSVNQSTLSNIVHHFKDGVLPRKAFNATFKKLMATKDPCNAQVLAMGLEHNSGFGSRVNSYIDELMVALHGGFSVALCASPSSSQKFAFHSWTSHFENDLPVCQDAAQCRGTEEMGSMAVSKLGREMKQCLANPDTGRRKYLVEMRRFLLYQTFMLNKHTRHKVITRLQNLGIGKNTVYIGVHVRHGDKEREAAPVPTHEYGEAVAAALGNTSSTSRRLGRLRRTPQHDGTSWPNGAGAGPGLLVQESLSDSALAAIRSKAKEAGAQKVYVASDDPSAFGILKRYLGKDFDLVEQPRTDESVYADRTYSGAGDGSDDPALLAVLTDIMALKGARFLAGTSTSNIGELLFYLRGGKDMITMDGDGDWIPLHDCGPLRREKRSKK